MNSATLNTNQPRKQSELCCGYSTAGRINIMNEVVEKLAEYNESLCLAFINKAKAFGSHINFTNYSHLRTRAHMNRTKIHKRPWQLLCSLAKAGTFHFRKLLDKVTQRLSNNSLTEWC